MGIFDVFKVGQMVPYREKGFILSVTLFVPGL